MQCGRNPRRARAVVRADQTELTEREGEEKGEEAADIHLISLLGFASKTSLPLLGEGAAKSREKPYEILQALSTTQMSIWTTGHKINTDGQVSKVNTKANSPRNLDD